MSSYSNEEQKRRNDKSIHPYTGFRLNEITDSHINTIMNFFFQLHLIFLHLHFNFSIFQQQPATRYSYNFTLPEMIILHICLVEKEYYERKN